MSMTVDLRDAFRNAGLAGGNVYRDKRPAIAPLPAIVLETISDPRGAFMKGDDALGETRVQANCLAASREEADALRNALLALRPQRVTVGTTNFRRIFIEGGRTDFDQPASGDTTYRTIVDLMVWHRPAR